MNQALSLAIDREAIVKDLWRGQGIELGRPLAEADLCPLQITSSFSGSGNGGNGACGSV